MKNKQWDNEKINKNRLQTQELESYWWGRLRSNTGYSLDIKASSEAKGSAM